MECPKCGYELPDTATFCIECDHKKDFICPECSTTHILTAKFCIECGTKPFASNSPDLSPLEEKKDKIQRYLPEDLTQNILSQKDRIEGETRLMLVLAKICLKTPHRFLAEPVGR